MHLALRPYVTSGVAIVGASVLVAAPITVTPPDLQIANPAESLELAQRATDVELTSVVTDLLHAFQVVSVAGGETSQILIDALGALPQTLAGAIQAAIDNPELIPNVASFLAYQLLSPVPILPPELAPLPTLLQLLQAVQPVLGLLPPELQAVLAQALTPVLGLITEGLGLLPNPLPGAAALGAGIMNLPDFVTDLTGTFDTLVSAIGTALGGGVVNLPVAPGVTVPVADPGLFGFIGAAPQRLLGLLQGVIDGDIALPTALSTIVYGLVYPLPVPSGVALPPLATASLLSAVALPIVAALAQTLPPSLAGPFLEAFGAIGDVVVRVLGILPTPLPPFPQTASMLTANALDVAEAPQITPTIAAPAPAGGLGGVLEAVQLAADQILAIGEQLPAGVELLVQAISANPSLAPLAIVTFANRGIDGFEAAIAPIAAALIGSLPEGLQLPAGRALQQLGTAIDGIQDDIQDAVTPEAAVKKQSEPQTLGIAGTDTGEVDGPEVTPKKHRPRVELNVFKINPLDQNNEDGDNAVQVADDGGTTTTVKHRPGVGMTPVGDLVKRVLGGLDNDDDGGAEADQGAAAAAG